MGGVGQNIASVDTGEVGNVERGTMSEMVMLNTWATSKQSR